MTLGTPPPRVPAITRRRFLLLAAVAAGGGLAIVSLDLAGQESGSRPGSAVGSGGASGAAARASASQPLDAPSASTASTARRSFRSRPDLHPPLLDVTVREAALAPGFIFLTPANGAPPDGPTIIDDAGELVWMLPETAKNATDLRVATYRGQPVLTWWEGDNNAGIGSGAHVVMDASYREIARIGAANGRTADLHEFQITPRGTALYFADAGVDATPAAGATAPPPSVMDCAIQEVDIATGQLLFEWHVVDHIDLAESVVAAPTAEGQVYDYVHTNAIEVDTDGNLLVSARNTSAIYKIDRITGQIRWRLGGKRSDFSMGPGATFALQHDVRRQPDGTITVFDDGQAPGTSRAIVLRLDESAMTATLVREYRQPQNLLATSQGNVQVLPNGNVFVGWGSLPRFSEFAAGGMLLYDAAYSSTQSYRDHRYTWVGRPADRPAIAVDASAGAMTVYASWNGATEVASWEVLAGQDRSALKPVAAVPRRGFETAIAATSSAPLVAVRARDAAGVVLGTSLAISILG